MTLLTSDLWIMHFLTYQNNCWGKTKFLQKSYSRCGMFALMHAHTHREIPSLVVGGGQKSTDNGTSRCSCTNLGLMKTCPV